MTLTPADIEQKTFSTALRGYNLDEVDDFLDEIVRTMRKLHTELEEAQAASTAVKEAPPARLVEAEPKVMEPPPPPPPPPIDASAVGKALVAAQETADRIISDARGEAETILAGARTDADAFEETRLRRQTEAEEEIARIDALVGRVRSDIADLSASVEVELDEMSGTLANAVSEIVEPPGDETVGDEALEAGGDGPAEEDAAAEVEEEPGADDSADDENEDDGSEEEVNAVVAPVFYDQDNDSAAADDDEYEFEDVKTPDSEGVSEETSDDGDDDYFIYPDSSDDEDDDGVAADEVDNDDEDDDDEDDQDERR